MRPGVEDPPPAPVPTEYRQPLKLFTVLARAGAALMERSRQDVARHGLTTGEFSVLEALYHKGPLLQSEIKSKILVSSGGITYLVDRLVARGLVERRQSVEDRRARYAVLTGEGRAFMERIFPEHAEALAQATAGLSSEEKEAAIHLLKQLGYGARDAR